MPFLALAVIVIGVLLVTLTPSKAFGYVSGLPTEIQLEPIGNGMFLRFDAANAFKAMRSAADDDGVLIYPTSAFRTMEEQTELYNLYLAKQGNLAAKPGYSNHQSGFAVDIHVQGTFESPEYRWLAVNAERFGYVNTGAKFSQREPWHWEFV